MRLVREATMQFVQGCARLLPLLQPKPTELSAPIVCQMQPTGADGSSGASYATLSCCCCTITAIHPPTSLTACQVPTAKGLDLPTKTYKQQVMMTENVIHSERRKICGWVGRALLKDVLGWMWSNNTFVVFGKQPWLYLLQTAYITETFLCFDVVNMFS